MPCTGTENEMLHERYAQVLIDEAQGSNKLDEVLESLTLLQKQASENEDFAKVLCHPEIEKADKKRLLDEIARKLGFPEELRLFIRLLIDKKRLSMLHGVLLKYRDLYNIEKRRQRLTIESAVLLSKGQIARLKDIFKRSLSKEVIITESKDPSIVGGINIRVANTVYKLSLADRLKYLEERLTGQ